MRSPNPTTRAESKTPPQSEIPIVASRFRDAVQVTPAADEVVDALLAVSMVALPDELLQHIFRQACNPLKPRRAVALSSASHGLWAVTQEGRQQLRADHEAAAALCLKVGLRSCKELREAKQVDWRYKGLSSDDLALLGTLGSVLPALQTLILQEPAAGPDGMQRLAEGLGAGALPAVIYLALVGVHVGDAGASTLAAALGRGACVAHMKTLELQVAHGGQAARAQPLRQPLHAVGAGCWLEEAQRLERWQHRAQRAQQRQVVRGEAFAMTSGGHLRLAQLLAAPQPRLAA